MNLLSKGNTPIGIVEHWCSGRSGGATSAALHAGGWQDGGGAATGSFSKLRRKAAAIPPSGCCDSGGGAAKGSFSKLRRKAAAVEPAGSVGAAAAAAPDLGPAGSGLWAQAWSSCWTDESRATDGMRGS